MIDNQGLLRVDGRYDAAKLLPCLPCFPVEPESSKVLRGEVVDMSKSRYKSTSLGSFT